MMARRIDEDATVIDAYPQAFFERDEDSTSTECTKPRLQENRPVNCVGFDRYQVDRSGGASELGHVFLRAHLKEVPRSPGNSAGLMIVDTAISERL
jgi:hypothetical protein